jgi:CRP-like cAMP-binding protein
MSNEYEYLLLEGVCQTYILGHDGEEVTLNFFQGPTVLTPNIIRSSSGKSILNARLLTNGIMARLPVQLFGKLIEDNQEIRAFANTVLQQELIHKTKKEVQSATLSADKRLQLLRDQFPKLENQVSQKHIASYLGISPESLSRIRKK